MRSAVGRGGGSDLFDDEEAPWLDGHGLTTIVQAVTCGREIADSGSGIASQELNVRVPSISSFTRRHFLSRSGLFGLASTLPISSALSYFVKPVLAAEKT